MISRFVAAAVVSAAVLLGSMIAADRGAARFSDPFQGPGLDWQTIADDVAGPVGDWSPEDPTDPTDTKTAPLVPPPATTEGKPLESFRPSPPMADTRQLAAKIEALEVRVAALEAPRVVTTPAVQPPRIVTQTMTYAPAAASAGTVCVGGVCRRVTAATARLATYPTRRFFRR